MLWRIRSKLVLSVLQILQNSQNFLLIYVITINPLVPPPPSAGNNPTPSPRSYLSHGPKRALLDLSLYHVACAVYPLLFICLHVQLHSLKYINSLLQIICFFTELRTLHNSILEHVEIKYSSNIQTFANTFKAIPCSVQQHRGKMGEGTAHRYSISKFNDLSHNGW